MTMSMNGQQMTMKTDSQKLGTALHPTDPAGGKVRAPGRPLPGPDPKEIRRFAAPP